MRSERRAPCLMADWSGCPTRTTGERMLEVARIAIEQGARAHLTDATTTGDNPVACQVPISTKMVHSSHSGHTSAVGRGSCVSSPYVMTR